MYYNNTHKLSNLSGKDKKFCIVLLNVIMVANTNYTELHQNARDDKRRSQVSLILCSDIYMKYSQC